MNTAHHDGAPPMVVVSSAHRGGVAREAAAIAAFLRESPDVSVGDVAAALDATRGWRRFRAVIVAADRAELLENLDALAQGRAAGKTAAGEASARTIAMVFPGQGSQRPGMGLLAHSASPGYRATVAEYDLLFDEIFGFRPGRYLLEPEHGDDIRVVQPALFVHMIGLAELWREHGVEPDMAIGHSQGEIAAARVAGLIGARDAVRVVGSRARLVHDLIADGRLAADNAMAVIGADRDTVEAALARQVGWAELSVVNAPGIHAIAGETPAIDGIVGDMADRGVFARRIRVDYPAHTSLVGAFRDDFLGLLDDLDEPRFDPAAIPCFGGALGGPITPDLDPATYWYWNLRNRVRFDLAVERAAEAGADVFIEASEHPTLQLSINGILAGIGGAGGPGAVNIGTLRRDDGDLSGFLGSLAAVRAVHRGLDAPVGTSPGAVPWGFPATVWERAEYWAPGPDAPVPGGGVPARPAPTPAPVQNPLTRAGEPPLVLSERWSALGEGELAAPDSLCIVGADDAFRAELAAAAARFGDRIVDEPAAAGRILVLPPDGGTGDEPAEAMAAFLADAHRELADAAGTAGTACLVTRGGESAGDAAPGRVDAGHAAAAAMMRCIGAATGPGPMRIDVEPDDDPAETARSVIRALHATGEPEIAVRGRELLGRRFVPISAGTPDVPPTVVIIGGTGPVGRAFAARCVALGAADVVLVSRNAPSAAVAAEIAGLADGGTAAVRHVRCDATDRAQLARLAADLGSAGPRLIVHCTVDYASAESAAADDGAADAGAWHRADAAKRGSLAAVVAELARPGDRVLACSSLSAGIGGRGHAAYAAVNRLLEVEAARARENGVDALAIRWGLWHGVGADNDGAIGEIEAIGLRPMDPDAAVDAALGLFGGDDAMATVASGDWRKVAAVHELRGMPGLFSRIAGPPAPETPVKDGEPAAAETAPAPGASAGAGAIARSVLLGTLGYAEGDDPDPTVPLVSLGLDSVQALDACNRITSATGAEVPIAGILSGASLDDVVAMMTEKGRD